MYLENVMGDETRYLTARVPCGIVPLMYRSVL